MKKRPFEIVELPGYAGRPQAFVRKPTGEQYVAGQDLVALWDYCLAVEKERDEALAEPKPPAAPVEPKQPKKGKEAAK